MAFTFRIPRTGQVAIEDGELVFKKDGGGDLGRLFCGPDGPTLEGEFNVVQVNDPPKINLIAFHEGFGMGGGALTGKVGRADGRGGEQLGQLIIAHADDAGNINDIRGEAKLRLRLRGTDREDSDVLVATTAYSEKQYGEKIVYVAMNRPLSNLGQFNPPGSAAPTTSYGQFGLTGDGPSVPPPTDPPVVSTGGQLISSDLRFLTVQQEDGNYVTYRRDTMQPVFDSFSFLVDNPDVQPGPPVVVEPPPVE